MTKKKTPIPPPFPLQKNIAGERKLSDVTPALSSAVPPTNGGRHAPAGEREPIEYTTGQWAGKAYYQCNQCAFDVLEDRKAMLAHLMDAHASMWAMEELIKLETAEARAAK